MTAMIKTEVSKVTQPSNEEFAALQKALGRNDIAEAQAVYEVAKAVNTVMHVFFPRGVTLIVADYAVPSIQQAAGETMRSSPTPQDAEVQAKAMAQYLVSFRVFASIDKAQEYSALSTENDLEALLKEPDAVPATQAGNRQQMAQLFQERASPSTSPQPVVQRRRKPAIECLQQ